MRRFLVLVLVISFFKQAYGQDIWSKGYIVTIKNDTLFGELLETDKSEFSSIRYRTERKGPEKVIYSNEAKLVVYSRGNSFFSLSTNKVVSSSGFYKILAEGKADLFSIQDYYILRLNDSAYYQLKNQVKSELLNGTTVTRDTYSYRGILNYALYDCEKVRAEIQTFILTSENLVALINKFNSCFQEVKEVTLKKETSLSIGLITGVTSRTDTHSTDISGANFVTNGKVKISPTYFWGLSAQYKFNDKFTISFDIYSFNADAEAQLSQSSEDNNIEYSSSVLQFSVLPRVSFRKRGIVPFVFAGPTIANYSKQESYRQRVIKLLPNIRQEQEFSDFYNAQAGFGLLIGTGVQYRSDSRITPYLECKAATMISNVDLTLASGSTVIIDSKQFGKYLNIGALFRL